MTNTVDSPQRQPDTHAAFTHDVRRSVLLSAYIRSWGMPRDRVVARHGDTGRVVEVYVFPAHEGQPLARFATVGVSAHPCVSGTLDKELLIALPADLGGATQDAVISFMLDIATYAIYTREDIEPPFTVPETPLAPSAWATRALLVDQARGEPEELGAIELGDHAVELLWVIPVYPSEYRFIKASGLDAFDALDEQSEFSLVDIGRPPLV